MLRGVRNMTFVCFSLGRVSSAGRLLALKFASSLVLGHEMRLKISNRNSNLGSIASKLGEPKAISQAGAFFLLALAHESAQAKAFKSLSDIQQLIGESKVAPATDENAEALQAGFDDLLAVSSFAALSSDMGLDEAFESMARMSASDSQVVLAQNGINRAPVSDAAVDYIDPARFTAMKEATSLQSVPAPVPAPAAALADEGALSLKIEPELLLDPNALAATSAGPLLLPVPLLLGAGAVALAGGGGGGSGGSGGAAPANNIAVITGSGTGSVTTASKTTNGGLTVTDKDAGQAGTQAQNNVDGKYGTFNINTSGEWNYALDPTKTAFKALPKDVVGVDSFTVKSLDGSTQKIVNVDVKGVNDAPTVIKSAQNIQLQEQGSGVTGNDKAVIQLTLQDVDQGDTPVLDQSTLSANGWTSINNGLSYTKAGTYGSASILIASNEISYTLNNTLADTDALPDNAEVQDQFSVFVKDGYGGAVTQAVSFVIKGSNDLSVISGTNTGSLREAGGTANGIDSEQMASGNLSASDVDGPANSFKALQNTKSMSGYGFYSVSPGGTWTYKLDNSNELVNALKVGDTLSDRFNVLTGDGASAQVTISIFGQNDAPTISGEGASFSNLAKPTSTVPNVQNGEFTFNDIDSMVKAFTIETTAAQSGETFTAYIQDKLSNETHSGTVKFSYTATNSAAPGEKDFTIVLKDDLGLSDSYVVHIGLV